MSIPVTIFHHYNQHDSYFIGEKHFGEAPKYDEVTTVDFEEGATDEDTAEAVWLAFEAGAPGDRHPAKEAQGIRSFMVGDVIGLDIVDSSQDRFYRVASYGFVRLTHAEARRVVSTAMAVIFDRLYPRTGVRA